MSDVEVTCSCGHTTRMSEFAVGMAMDCPACGKQLDYGQVRAVAETPPEAVEPFARSSDERRATTAPIDSSRRGEGRRSTQDAQSDTGASEARVAPTPRGRSECVRCGRRFRGDWDVHETPKGPLCYICVNRVSEVAPQATPVETVEPVVGLDLPPIRKSAGLLDPEPALESAAPRFQFDPSHPTFRRILWVAAISVIVLALYFWVTGGSLQTAGESGGASANVTQGPMGKLPFVLVLIVQAVCNCSGTIVAIYLTLWYRDKLPMEAWWANALHIGVVGLCLGAVQAILMVVPMIGGIAALLATFWVCFEVYDFGLMEFVTMVVMWIPAGSLVMLTRYLLLGLIANVFF